MVCDRQISTLLRAGAAIFLGFVLAADSFTRELTVYPPLPNRQFGSDLYQVIVSQDGRGSPSYVYKSTREANNPYNRYRVFSTDANHWTSFSFSGPVTVRVKLLDRSAVRTAIIHPLAKGIRAAVKHNVVSFTLTQPANLYVELDNKPREPLFIFASPPEADVPAADAPHVIRFGPGVTDLGKEPCYVADGETVYLAGGAYVKGRLEMSGPKGDRAVSIRGRGTLSGIDIAEKRGSFSQYMIDGAARKIDAVSRKRVPEIHVEGIVITDSPGPNIFASVRVVAENVKLLSWSRCSDGIFGGRDSVVQGCFFKVNDDVIHFHSSGMKAADNVVWLQAAGSALQMGWNVTDDVNGAHVDGLDIIGDDTGRKPSDKDWLNCDVVALMDTHNHAAYRNIVVENVRHEGRPYQLFGVRTKLADEDKGHAEDRQGLGSVDGMIFRNIAVAQEPQQTSVFDGNGAEPGSISNVTFENMRIAAVLVTSANASVYVTQRGKTSDFHYAAAGNPVPQKQSR